MIPSQVVQLTENYISATRENFEPARTNAEKQLIEVRNYINEILRTHHKREFLSE